MHTDQARYGQERLSSDAPAQRTRVGIAKNFDAPAISAKPDVAIESPGGSSIRSKVGQAKPDIRSSQMNQVVAKEDTVSVGFIARSVVVRPLGWADVDTSAQMGVLRAQVLADVRCSGRAESL